MSQKGYYSRLLYSDPYYEPVMLGVIVKALILALISNNKIKTIFFNIRYTPYLDTVKFKQTLAKTSEY